MVLDDAIVGQVDIFVVDIVQMVILRVKSEVILVVEPNHERVPRSNENPLANIELSQRITFRFSIRSGFSIYFWMTYWASRLII